MRANWVPLDPRTLNTTAEKAEALPVKLVKAALRTPRQRTPPHFRKLSAERYQLQGAIRLATPHRRAAQKGRSSADEA